MKKIVRTLGIGILASTFFWAVPTYAQAETETAGSSMKEESYAEENIEFYHEEREKPKGEWKKDEKGWWYEYSDGTYPKRSWRKIDGQWYYFNSKGYWIDDNTYEDGSLKGIDVSKWQEEIDWQAVKNDGIDFAMIRLGYNTNQLDKYYQRNMKEAEKAEIPVGVYYYSKAMNEAEAVRDAEFVIENLKGYKVSYPVAIDLEDKVQESLTKKELGKIARAFADEIQSAGYTPMVYVNENWYQNYIDWSLLGDVEKWIASYSVSPNPKIKREIWQCCSTGLVDGVKGDVDINFGYKDYTKYIIPRTEPMENYYKRGKWVQDSTGWWYRYKNGQYPKNQWEYIDNHWYWFNESGYMTTGWQQVYGKWYYMDPWGAMTTGWQQIADHWYYMNDGGVMTTGWQQVYGKWYYMDPWGAMTTGWQQVYGKWYYMDPWGAMTTGWQYIGGIWYYMNEGGDMQTGWLYLSGKWYYLNYSGAMVTGRHYIDGKWYFFNSSGVMQ